MIIDVPKEIRRTVDTGKVFFGIKCVEKTLLNSNARLVIFSESVPKLLKERIVHIAGIATVPFFDFNGTAHELGAVCGKPFIISSMVVIDTGKSKILDALKKEKETSSKEIKPKHKTKSKVKSKNKAVKE